MLVKALTDCFVENTFRREGDEFEYSGAGEAFLEPLEEAQPVKGKK